MTSKNSKNAQNALPEVATDLWQRKNGLKCTFAGIAFLLLLWLFVIPMGLFRGAQYSTVVESTEGELLGARIAADGQWRFPPSSSLPAASSSSLPAASSSSLPAATGNLIPQRFATALVQFEDRHFYRHPGVNPIAIVRALRDNIRSGHVVSGGSTITMQVIRLSRGGERNIWNKLIEAEEAIRLECRHKKREILALYAANAPFGGNVVGLDAAAWRYFGRPPEELSWAESATLAVLPNAPASIHPGRDREALREKRNRLLKRLLDHGDIDQDTYDAAVTEPLPDEPLPLPGYASHFVESAPKGLRTRSTIQFGLQRAVEEAVVTSVYRDLCYDCEQVPADASEPWLVDDQLVVIGAAARPTYIERAHIVVTGHCYESLDVDGTLHDEGIHPILS